MELVDIGDLKSPASNSVRVQVSPRVVATRREPRSSVLRMKDIGE